MKIFSSTLPIFFLLIVYFYPPIPVIVDKDKTEDMVPFVSLLVNQYNSLELCEKDRQALNILIELKLRTGTMEHPGLINNNLPTHLITICERYIEEENS